MCLRIQLTNEWDEADSNSGWCLLAEEMSRTLQQVRTTSTQTGKDIVEETREEKMSLKITRKPGRVGREDGSRNPGEGGAVRRRRFEQTAPLIFSQDFGEEQNLESVAIFVLGSLCTVDGVCVNI